jgi:hypothetical protein
MFPIGYPDDWPLCPVCEEPALDGHITCGSANCNEGEERRKRADAYAVNRAKIKAVPCE